MMRRVKIAVVQTGPATESKEANIEANLMLLDQALKLSPDFVVFPELSTTMYWPTGGFNPKYFEYAETIPGPTTDMFAERAKESGCYIILPLYERGKVEGQFYNSAAVIGSDGRLVYGTLPDGSRVHCYRKNHLSKQSFEDFVLDETFYMGWGPGLPVFKTNKATIGILICRDRWFPECWRILALMGAEIVFIPSASSGFFAESYVRTLRTWAQENQLFAVGCNKAGVEKVEREIRYYGLSCIVGPRGNAIEQATEAENSIISATIDLAEIQKIRRGLPYFKDRRTEIYDVITRHA